MSHGSPPARLGPAPLVDDDRFPGRRILQGLHETHAVLHSLDVGGDDLGFRVFCKVVEKLAFVHVEAIPIAHNLAEPKTPGAAVVGDVLRMASALRNETDGSGLQGIIKMVEHPALGHIQTHTVRADDPKASGPCLDEHLLLQVGPLPVPALPEARSKEVDRSHPFFRTLVQEFQDRFRRNVHDHVIDNARNGRDARIAWKIEHLPVFRIDRIDRGKTRPLEGVDNQLREGQLRRRNTHNGNAPRAKHLIQCDFCLL